MPRLTAEQISAAIDAAPQARVIPTLEGEPNYTMRVRLDGRDYNLRLLWNERTQRWHLSIYGDEQEPLAIGIKVVTNWPMLRYLQWDARLPPGELFAIATTSDDSPPGFYDLAPDKRVQLIYFPLTDL
jgi:hypothetical protein